MAVPAPQSSEYIVLAAASRWTVRRRGLVCAKAPRAGTEEYSPFNDRTKEIFHGCPEWKDEYLWVSEKPGWGIEIDEQAALKAPFTPGRENLNGGWGEIRRADGTVIK
jgi:mannonate dehydratase